MSLSSRMFLACVALFLVSPAPSRAAAPTYQRVRRHVAGMTAEWTYAGIKERRPGSRDAIIKMGPKTVPFLIEMLDEKDDRIRRGAVTALGFFPERAADSIPPLLRAFQRTEHRYELQGISETLLRLLPKKGQPSEELLVAIKSDLPCRRMVAVQLVLHQDPTHAGGRAALLRSLQIVPRPDPGIPTSFSDEDYAAAWHALYALEALPATERAFALPELKRIADFPTDLTSRFTELDRLRDKVCEVLNAKPK